MNVIHYPCWHSHELWNCLKAYGSKIKSCVCSYLTLIKLLKALMYEHFFKRFSRIFSKHISMLHKVGELLKSYSTSRNRNQINKNKSTFHLSLGLQYFWDLFLLSHSHVCCWFFLTGSALLSNVYCEVVRIMFVWFVSFLLHSYKKFDDYDDLSVLTIYPNKNRISHA